MKGMFLSEQGHIVNALPPIDATGGATADRFSMANHAHATITVMIGVSGSAPTSILLYECSAATEPSPSDKAAIGFTYSAETTASGDTLGALTTVAATGITSVTANDNTMYVIELDASELSDGFEWVEVAFNVASGVSCLAAVHVALTGTRHQHAQGATAIA